MSDTKDVRTLADRLNKLIEQLPHNVEPADREPAGPPDHLQEEGKKSENVSNCVATVRFRVKKTALFRAALFEGDHMAGMSTQVKVRVR